MRAHSLASQTASRNSQAGNSVVEFAVVAPVLVMLILYATYFHDGLRTKLKVQEAARFGAWEFTSLPMSDFFQGNHDVLYTDAQARVMLDVKAKYATFDSSRPNAAVLSETFIAKHTFLVDPAHLSATNNQVDLVDTDALALIGGAAAGGATNAALKVLENLFKFNSKGMVVFTATGRFENRILPSSFQDDRFQEKMTPPSLTSFEMSDHVALIVDGWTLHNGQDSNLARDKTGGTEIAGRPGPHPFAAQVDRMKFMGLPNFVPSGVQRVLENIDKYFPMEFQEPLFSNSTPVASLNYRNEGNGDDWACNGTAADAPKHGMESLNRHGRKLDLGLDCYNTAPLRVTLGFNASPLKQIMNDSGKHYMRCKTEQASDPVNCNP